MPSSVVMLMKLDTKLGSLSFPVLSQDLFSRDHNVRHCFLLSLFRNCLVDTEMNMTFWGQSEVQTLSLAGDTR